MSKYKSAIEKITVTDATFEQSTEREIEPSWINFFYGNNGTGKSTIARTIRSGLGLSWNKDISPDTFSVLVFDKNFVSTEMSFDDETPLMPGVLMLGEENIETQRLIDEKQEQQRQLDTQIQNTKVDKTKKQTEKEALLLKLQKTCWDSAGRFYNAFGGRKGDFQSQVKCAVKVCRTAPVSHNFEELKSRFETATDPNAKRYELLTLLDLSKLSGIESFDLLSQPIISTADNAYSRFWQALNATDWVKQSHDRFSIQAGGKCPYCQQGLPRKFEEQLAACFDSRYLEDCEKLAKYGVKYTDYMMVFIETVRHHIQNIPLGFGDLKAYNDNLTLLEKTVEINNGLIASKIEKPSESILLNSVSTYLETINKLIEITNEAFKKNNLIFDDKKNNQEDCITKVWELLAFELQEKIKQHNAADAALGNDIKGLNRQIETDERSLSALKNEISRLTDKLGSSAATAEKINELLKKSGFKGFTLREYNKIPDKYVIVRSDGSIAKDLSEGERNFIAFLYFYHLVQGAWKKEDLRKGKIVVIDDPVSSMDSGVLFIVGSLVRALIDDCFLDGSSYNIKQIFILTHNPYFHKDVSFYRLGDENYRKVSFFEIKKSYSNISTVTPCEKKNNSTDSENEKENFSPVQNYYTSLWNEYKEVTTATTLLSVMNRIVEYHFVQLCNYSIADIRTNVRPYIGDNENEQYLINDILRYIYDNADNNRDMRDDPYFAAQRGGDEYKAAFRAVFKAMGQEQHYKRMSGEG